VTSPIIAVMLRDRKKNKPGVPAQSVTLSETMSEPAETHESTLAVHARGTMTTAGAANLYCLLQWFFRPAGAPAAAAL